MTVLWHNYYYNRCLKTQENNMSLKCQNYLYSIHSILNINISDIMYCIKMSYCKLFQVIITSYLRRIEFKITIDIAICNCMLTKTFGRVFS